MGFYSGRVSFIRYRVLGAPPSQFGPKQLEKLEAHAIGKQRVASGDGVEAGWLAGDDILDTEFDLAKNIINDTLHWALRIDVQKLPTDLLRAYARIELKALSANNPSGFPSARQKREAREIARERLELEAKDGRYLRRKAYPLLWDRLSNELLIGTTGYNVLQRVFPLFKETFGHSLEPLGAGQKAYLQAEKRNQTRSLDGIRLSSFVPDLSIQEVDWLPESTTPDFLGNEFLLWLWYVLDADSDTLALPDKSEVVAMLARSLVLECPRGKTGRESIRSEGPAQLPEARRAIRTGKLPRQAGLTLVRHGQQYEFTLQAETLAVTGARLPKSEEEDPRARLDERASQLRQLVETLDLLYEAFGRRRLSPDWSQELARLQKWLQRDDRRFSSAG